MFEYKPAVIMCRNFLFIVFLSLHLFACNNNDAAKKFEYYYYPARNIYYDVANAEFVYSVNGGKTWETFKKDLGKDPATLGSREIIYSDSQQPWDSNEADIKKYNGKLFNVGDEDTTVQANGVSDKKIIKKTNPVTIEPKKEKKPGFFKRLFGKKN
jgi:hypothetical protein